MLAAYLVLALTGAFTFSVIESCDFESRDRAGPVKDSLFASPDHRVDWLALESNNTARGHLSPALRGWTARVFLPWETYGAGTAFTQVPFGVIKKVSCTDKKSAIMVKLRI